MIDMNRFPLSHGELTRWNAAQPQPLGCPRHRTPEPLVATHHEVTDFAVWCCAECGYITPILDSEMRTALGSTAAFEPAHSGGDYVTDPRVTALPTLPAIRHTGTLAISPVTESTDGQIGAVLVATPLVLTLGAVLAPGWITILLAIVAASMCAAIAIRYRAHRAHEIATTAVVTRELPQQAGQLLTGMWVTTGQLPLHLANADRRAARVIQVARLGATAQIRITTTASTFTTPDTRPIYTITPADPSLTDFTYYPRGDR